MVNKNPFNGRKAASYMFSVILMTGIVAAAGLAVLQMGFSTMLETRTSLDVSTSYNVNKIQEKFIIEDVWFYTTGQVKVSVLNVGRIPVNITTISFNQTDITPTSAVILGEDQSATITVTFSWTTGTAYQVKVMSERGNVYESYWKA